MNPPQSLTTLVFICIQDIWYISRHRNTHSAYPVLLHSSFLVAGFDLLSFFRQSFQQFLSDIIPPFTPIHSLTIKKELTHHNNRQHYTYIVSYSVCLLAIKRTPHIGVWSARPRGLNIGGVRIPHAHPHSPTSKRVVLDTLFSKF